MAPPWLAPGRAALLWSAPLHRRDQFPLSLKLSELDRFPRAGTNIDGRRLHGRVGSTSAGLAASVRWAASSIRPLRSGRTCRRPKQGQKNLTSEPSWFFACVPLLNKETQVGFQNAR